MGIAFSPKSAQCRFALAIKDTARARAHQIFAKI
jgi:hypothetical protein